ncbi:MAG: hypothetical protein ACK559_01475, partial [bacterium]
MPQHESRPRVTTYTATCAHPRSRRAQHRQHKGIKTRRIAHAIIRFNGGCLLTLPPNQELELREVLGLPTTKICRQPHPPNKL